MKKIIKYIIYFSEIFYTKFYSIFHKIQKQVMFESFYGKQYSCNPRAVSEKLHELYPDFKIVWFLNKKDSYNLLPDYVEVIYKKNLNYFRKLATSFCYITNEGMAYPLSKRKKQLFLQFWHGDRGFKKILYEVHPKLYMRCLDDAITDFCIAGSDFGEERYKKAFKYSGKILKIGSPRNDRLVNVNNIEKSNIKKLLGISDNCKILLYAPTFRSNSKAAKSTYEAPDDRLDFEKLKSVLALSGDEWCICFRAHPTVNENVNNSFVYDVSKYPDMTDLLVIADILITDYSSSAQDFVLTGRPVLLANFDIEDYEKNSRSLWALPSDIGFLSARTKEELYTMLEQILKNEISQDLGKIKQFYGTNETGCASKIVCDLINTNYNTSFQKNNKE